MTDAIKVAQSIAAYHVRMTSAANNYVNEIEQIETEFGSLGSMLVMDDEVKESKVEVKEEAATVVKEEAATVVKEEAAAAVVEEETVQLQIATEETESQEAPKRRGRKPGSKNKTKSKVAKAKKAKPKAKPKVVKAKAKAKPKASKDKTVNDAKTPDKRGRKSVLKKFVYEAISKNKEGIRLKDIVAAVYDAGYETEAKYGSVYQQVSLICKEGTTEDCISKENRLYVITELGKQFIAA